MSIETLCQGCGKILRVASEHVGRLARCPQCQTVYTVPGVTPSPAVDLSDRWHLKTAEGLTFGPVPRGQLDRWLTEGRITPQSQICHEADGQWRGAVQIYPQLAALYPAPVPALNAYLSGTGYYGDRSGGGFLEPHRGGLILALALLGMFACDILSLVAVVMAAIDLSKMSRGAMDPSGRGLTVAGLVLSLIKVLLVGSFIFWMVLGR